MKLSFEFFPPKNEKMEELLWNSIASLKPFCPDFISVTYGAGGSTRTRTHDTIARIIKETDLKPASHLTCIGATKDEIRQIAQNYWDIGVRHIVALRGDLPDNYIHPSNDYSYAWQLVEGLKEVADFEISVAGYPEKHPEAKTMDADLDNLKRKVDAGATRVITQFFFDNNCFIEYLNLIEKKQIKANIVPGIMPIANFAQASKFVANCGATIPDELRKAFADAKSEEDNFKTACDFAYNQCEFLLNNNVKNFHFYTLNKYELTSAICKDLEQYR